MNILQDDSVFIVPYAGVNFLKDARLRELDSNVENKSLFRHQKYQQKIKRVEDIICEMFLKQLHNLG